jgi:hypothetical protein
MPKAGSPHGKWSDHRRRHAHWRVTIKYFDQQVFGRIYTSREKAEQFAARQQRSPVVASTRVEETVESRLARGDF